MSGRKKRKPAWWEEDSDWRKEARELKDPSKRMNVCGGLKCTKWMPKFDLHDLCQVCRGIQCNGTNVHCRQCRSWSAAQRNGL